jgi:hypothetical protein
MRGRVRILVAAIVLLGTARATAEPINIHIETPSTVHTDGGTDLRLPPGYFLDEGTHQKLDTEMRRLQDTETRLSAENTSLRSTLKGWQPGWIVLVVAAAGGVALGFYAGSKL